MPKRWMVKVSAEYEYSETEHGEFIASAEDARQDVIEWLAEAGPSHFNIEVTEMVVCDYASCERAAQEEMPFCEVHHFSDEGDDPVAADDPRMGMKEE